MKYRNNYFSKILVVKFYYLNFKLKLMKELLEKLNTLSEKRIKFYEENNGDNWFYKWSETYFKQVAE